MRRSFRSSSRRCCARFRSRGRRSWSACPVQGQNPDRIPAGRQAAARTCSATPCSGICERVQTVFTGIAAHVPFGVALAYHGQTRTSDGILVSGSYFPVLGAPAGTRAPARSGRRPEYRRKFRGRAQLRLLGVETRRESGRPQRHDRDQRPVVHDRRGRAARIQRDDAWNRSECVRPDLDARVDGPRLEGIRQPQVVLGVPLRPAEAGHVDRSGTRDDERVLPGDPERRRSPAAEGPQRCDDDAFQGAPAASRARCARPELDAPRGASADDVPPRPSPASC